MTPSRLQYQTKVSVPATDEFIVTEELLRKEYNIHWFGDNFRRVFFGRTVKAQPAQSIAIHRLQEQSIGRQLTDELGEQAVTPLSCALSLILNQRSGESGPLQFDGFQILIIVELEEGDGKKSLWVVLFCWDSDSHYWYVEANPFNVSNWWNDDYQILSCDS